MPAPDEWQIAKWLWENKDWLGRRLGRLREWFRGRSVAGSGILIIGPGGTGKTTLARLLAGEFDWLADSPWDYRESRGVECYGLSDDERTKVVVPPGQVHRRPRGWADVEQDIAAGRYRGIVVVGAFGYHALVESYKHHRLYEANKTAFLTAYLAACREDEQDILRKVAAAARVCPSKLWLLSLVTKQDLWTDEAAAVTSHYTATGPWGEIVYGLVSAKDPKLFRHELALASLLIANFETGVPERLKKNVAGYDHRAQVLTVRRLMEVIDALREWEGES